MTENIPNKKVCIDDIILSTKQRIKILRAERAMYGDPYHPSSHIPFPPNRFKNSLLSGKKEYGIALIAEVKPASPTKSGRKLSPYEAAEIAEQMVSGGASAISVLTEPTFFKGSLGNLKAVKESVDVAVLRKDFILDEIQLSESYQDAALLIASLTGKELPALIETCRKLGVEPFVEVRSIKEAEVALNNGVDVIGINNRNLMTFKINLETTFTLAPQIREIASDKLILVSESGIHNKEDVMRVADAGVDAILVGSALMGGDVLEKTMELACALYEDDWRDVPSPQHMGGFA
ncbi:MAG: indole-3-glycerol-phosphate synthase [Methermicoccaceae archaeon]